MVKIIYSIALFFLVGCGTHEYEAAKAPILDGVWANHNCNGEYEIIRIEDGTFEMKTNKTALTKSISGAIVIEGNSIKWMYETGEVYQNNFELNENTITLYRSEVVKFIKRADDFNRPNFHVTNNNNIDVKPADVKVDVKCDSCCDQNPKDPRQQQKPKFPFPCFGRRV